MRFAPFLLAAALAAAAFPARADGLFLYQRAGQAAPAATAPAPAAPAVPAPSALALSMPDVFGRADAPLMSPGPTVYHGMPPFSFTPKDGGLPAGVSLDAASGVLSGTPTSAGTYVLTLVVHDAAISVAETTIRVVIAASD